MILSSGLSGLAVGMLSAYMANQMVQPLSVAPPKSRCSASSLFSFRAAPAILFFYAQALLFSIKGMRLLCFRCMSTRAEKRLGKWVEMPLFRLWFRLLPFLLLLLCAGDRPWGYSWFEVVVVLNAGLEWFGHGLPVRRLLLAQLLIHGGPGWQARLLGVVSMKMGFHWNLKSKTYKHTGMHVAMCKAMALWLWGQDFQAFMVRTCQ